MSPELPAEGRPGGRAARLRLCCCSTGSPNLCNGSVQFILDHENGPVLKFAAMDSQAGAAIFNSAGWPPRPRSLVLCEDGRFFVDSTAACRVTRYLRRPWRWLGMAIVVPAGLRDFVYLWVADRRYQWFGKLGSCRVATKELAGKFL